MYFSNIRELSWSSGTLERLAYHLKIFLISIYCKCLIFTFWLCHPQLLIYDMRFKKIEYIKSLLLLDLFKSPLECSDAVNSVTTCNSVTICNTTTILCINCFQKCCTTHNELNIQYTGNINSDKYHPVLLFYNACSDNFGVKLLSKQWQMCLSGILCTKILITASNFSFRGNT